jgi:hypothetical protein
MKKEMFDTFPVNILEANRKIKKEAFDFRCDRYEIWHEGQRVASSYTYNALSATLSEGKLYVSSQDSSINQIMAQSFSFREISTNKDRILWSNDLLGNKEFKEGFPKICSLFYKDGKLVKVTFTIQNPHVLVELYSDYIGEKEPDIIKSAKSIFHLYGINPAMTRKPLMELFYTIKNNPSVLKKVNNFGILAAVFTIILEQGGITHNEDDLKLIVDLGYLFASIAISKNPKDDVLFKDRLVIMIMGENYLKNTVLDALGGVDPFTPNGRTALLYAHENVQKMMFFDLEQQPILSQNNEVFQEKKTLLTNMIINKRFGSYTANDILKKGDDLHNKTKSYLEDKFGLNDNDYNDDLPF